MSTVKPLNIIYFGTPLFSAQILESLIPNHNIVGLVTNPDSPSPSPVAKVGLKYHLPTFKPTTLDSAHLSHLKLGKPDLFLVVAYGKIFPASYLTIPTFNVHFSLLPKYRGALCIQEAIKNQDRETGVTFMKMTEKLDAGPIIAQSKVAIDINDNVADLTTKLTQSAISLLSTQLNSPIENLKLKIENSTALASYTPSLKTNTTQNAFISWDNLKNCDNPPKTHALIRSLNPEPGAWTVIHDQKIKILRTKLEKNQLLLETVQLPGKNPISWKQFLSGHKI